MASSTIHHQNILNLRNTNTRSSDDDEEDALVFKRGRFSHEPSSHMQLSIQRSRSWIQPIPIEEDTHSDSTGLEDDSRTQIYTSLFGFESDDDVFEEEVDASVETEEQLENGGVGLIVFLTDPDVLDCSICLDPLFAPIFQCENGHIACSSCCTKMKRKSQSGRDIYPCPFCDMKIGSRRNHCRGLEKFIKSISSISCKNAKYGCKKIMPYSKKNEHEQMCPHASCNCPFPSCYFAGSSKNLYHHFRIQHAAFTTPFTYSTPFSIDVDIDQKHILLQELHKNVIFVLNHEVREHGRDFTIDCVGVGRLKTSFVYKLTAKSMDTCHKMKSVPEVYTEWSKLTPEKDYLTVPFEFAGYDALLSLDVCIKKISISSEFDEEAEQVAGEVHGNDDGDNPLGSLQVVLTDPSVLDCSICLEPLTTPIYQTSWTSKFKPKIHTKWSEHTTRKNYFTVPSVFPGYTGLVSLSVCIKKGFDAMAWFVLEED
nr:aminotransferase-like mobile domain-containing protein [Tanacetum cinerariifolium]